VSDSGSIRNEPATDRHGVAHAGILAIGLLIPLILSARRRQRERDTKEAEYKYRTDFHGSLSYLGFGGPRERSYPRGRL
jgi:hypothetical protein